jgi:radical SAM superfamily enzyme YgiQ (UPF0313 family)
MSLISLQSRKSSPKKVLLVYPRANRDISDAADHGALSEPLALEYLGAGARGDGHEPKIIDLRLHSYDEYKQLLQDFQPDVVGVTGYSMHVLRALEICRTAKDEVPTCTTVVGGHHATLEPVDFFEPQVDYIIGGEGVGPFRAILATDSSKKAFPIPGVHAQIDGEFRHGGAPEPYDINNIPWPARDLTGADRLEYNINWMKPLALARTSVGCPYRCSFCALWRIMDGRYYTREIARTAEEIASIKEKYVLLVDDEAFVNKKRMTELATALADQGVEKEYFAYCRLDTLTRERDLMKQWRDVGLTRLLIGVETVFDWELADYNKRQTRGSILRGLEAADQMGLRLMCNFVVHPQYGDDEFDGMLEFIRENGLEYPSFTVWTPIPATVNYDEIELTHRQPNGRPNWDYFDLNHAVTPTKMPPEQFARRFESLYWMFSSTYAEHGANREAGQAMTHDPTKAGRKQEELSQAYARLAAKVLGISSKPSLPST